MALPGDGPPETRFDSFDIYTTSYKKIGTHEIEVNILVPKNLKPATKHPIVVKFHGGALITGTSLYPSWTASYIPPFIHHTSALLLLPNYRLLPEHTGADIASDLSSFWTWLATHAPSTHLATHHHTPLTLDYTRVLVAGESAGGYLALMSAFDHRDCVRAVMAQYPMTGPLEATGGGGVAPEYARFGGGVEVPGVEVLDAHVACVGSGTVVSGAWPPERMALALAMSVSGRYLEYFGGDEGLWPISRIEGVESMPATWIVHGEGDGIVSVEGSKKFVERWRGRGVKGEVRLDVREGDHGFDIDVRADEGWVRDGVEWLIERWLGD